MRQNPKRRARNRVFTSAARTFIRKARNAFEDSAIEEARQATLEAVSALDKAAEKGVLHKNNAARRKSRLMHKLSQLEKQSK